MQYPSKQYFFIIIVIFSFNSENINRYTHVIQFGMNTKLSIQNVFWRLPWRLSYRVRDTITVICGNEFRCCSVDIWGKLLNCIGNMKPRAWCQQPFCYGSFSNCNVQIVMLLTRWYPKWKVDILRTIWKLFVEWEVLYFTANFTKVRLTLTDYLFRQCIQPKEVISHKQNQQWAVDDTMWDH